MTQGKIATLLATLVLLVGFGVAISRANRPSPPDAPPAANPALSVSVVRPQMRDIPVSLTANGSIAAWQEAVIGAEVGELRLSAVNVQVGEAVRKGQILATFSEESVQADVAQSRAVVAEAEANLADAKVNADRATRLASKALSAQQVDQYLTTEKTALAKLQLAKAQLDAQLLRLKYTKVLASDDGVISSRSATLGAVAAKGEELFRLIRQNRLEWRGEVTAAEMPQLKPGISVTVEVPNVGSIDGAVRFLAPTLDVQNRNGLVYVDLPDATLKGLRAGMFARGEFHLGASAGLTVPQEALSLRDGFSYVFRLADQAGDRARVQQVKVQLGRRIGDALEILSGLQPDDQLVAGGASFLADGDSVRVVTP
ncbi:efflux RND transporter periplasmic adaptor subunit [Methylomonas sp. LL1]|uniref:efflux RND transporter periplasmic adaptor subunit n=1 Tax=Methylomonas sp. LL1 TaxID=2785785 RepID=UPI0018C37D58|nr:efflux RND transporter periplasmic adaptor subunit [Methylomonas sp. LL1]QPK62433.1 efflux RND transporter periplasmic adaptor subunit [Methylomonas sp. LL1]